MPMLNTTITTDITLSRVAQMRKRGQYIADQIAPPFPVEQKMEYIMLIDPTARMLKQYADLRAPGTVANVADVNVSRPAQFNCTHKALSDSIPDEITASPIQALQSLQLYAGNIAETVKLQREIRLKNLIVGNLTGAALTTSVAAADKFDAATAQPVTYLQGKITTVQQNSGVRPNCIALDIAVMDKIGLSAEFRDQFKYTGVMTADARAAGLAKLLGLDEVIVASTNAYNTAATDATPSFTPTWSKAALIFYKEPPAIVTSNFMTMPVWTVPSQQAAMQGGMVDGWRVQYLHDQKAHATWIEVGQYYDFVQGYDAGNALTPAHLLTACIA